MEETICIASHFADDCVSHMLFKCEEMLFSWGFLPSKSIGNHDFMLRECFYENMFWVKYFSCCPYRIRVLAQSGLISFSAFFPIFYCWLFLLLPFLLLYLFLSFRGSTRRIFSSPIEIFSDFHRITIFTQFSDSNLIQSQTAVIWMSGFDLMGVFASLRNAMKLYHDVWTVKFMPLSCQLW